MPNETITLEDLVHSFLKSLKQRGIDATVIYRYQAGGRAVMKMTGNNGPEGSKAMLGLIATQVQTAAAQIEGEDPTTKRS
jgi:hypothetical protein